MIYLNDKVVAYLNENKIAFNNGDFAIYIIDGVETITSWNTSKLGAQPTQEQLDSAYATQQANIAATEQAKIDLKASAHAKLAAIGLTPEEIAYLGA